MDQEQLIVVNNISKSFAGHQAVVDVSFALKSGEILSLLGPNGAGKTTTIKMVLGLITPTSGKATIMNYDMANDKEMRKGIRHVGAVLEGARNAYWRLSVLENLRYFGGLRAISRQVIDKRAEQLLQMLTLQDKRDVEVRKLSRGMQQKVAIANALMHDPQILVLDEPTLGLDVEAAKLLEETIVLLVKEGKAVLLTTHVMSLAERLSDRIFVINKGRQVAYDETQVLLQQFTTDPMIEIKLKRPLSPSSYAKIAGSFPHVVYDGESVLEWAGAQQQQIIALYALLDESGAAVLNITHRTPKLEDVFLSLTRKESMGANGNVT